VVYTLKVVKSLIVRLCIVLSTCSVNVPAPVCVSIIIKSELEALFASHSSSLESNVMLVERQVVGYSSALPSVLSSSNRYNPEKLHKNKVPSFAKAKSLH
jgi:hypothetical protein